ncbi:hypothetical protein ACS0TY_000491 [Phlomoides rotata]
MFTATPEFPHHSLLFLSPPSQVLFQKQGKHTNLLDQIPMDSDLEKSISENNPADDNIIDEINHKSEEINQDIDDEVDTSSSPYSDPKLPEIRAELDDPGEIKFEESSPLPPDIRKITEEIDLYISSLLTSQGEASIPPDVPISIEQFLVLFEDKIEEYDSGDSPVKWSRLTDEDSMLFLEALNRVSSLSKALSKFSSQYKYAYSINRTGGVIQRAMSYLEEEFKSLLEDYKIRSSDPVEVTDLGYSDENLSNLIRVSKAMLDAGYETECCEVYYVVRRNALEESLHKLGFEKHSNDEVHKMSWESLEKEIENRITKFKKFVEYQISTERKLCDHVFPDHPSISERLFISVSHGVTIQFLNFAEAVTLTKRSAEKLIKLLETFEAVKEVVAKIEGLLREGQSIDDLKNEASIIRSHLGEAMISIFNELENSIRADSVKNPVSGGAVHPLTKYIMNYLESASFYKDSLEQVFLENQKIEKGDSSDNEKQSPSPFQSQLLKIMDLLDANIEAKSKLYKDTSLSSIFMMNNGRFTLKKIKRSNELNSLLGENWYRKKSSELRNYHKGYQRETWGKLLSYLNPEGLTVNGKVMKPLLKERFKSFNAMFDEIRKTQSHWVIADEQLRSELRVSISNMVIPAYRSFLSRHSQIFTPGRQTEKYVKLTAEEIEASVDELFSGVTPPTGRKKQKE